jgi:hypothetical protein
MESGQNQYSSPMVLIPQGDKGLARDKAAQEVSGFPSYVQQAEERPARRHAPARGDVNLRNLITQWLHESKKKKSNPAEFAKCLILLVAMSRIELTT